MNATDDLLPPELDDLLTAELATGERIVWAGQPIPSRFARRSLGVVLFAIPWTAFAVFWIAGASGFKIPDFSKGFGFFPLFGIPFVLIGLGMLGSPLWMRRQARRTVYALTDRRALIVEVGIWGRVTVQSFEPERLTELKRTQYADGSGDLILDRQLRNTNQGQGHMTDLGFFGIPDVKRVEDLVRDLVKRAKSLPA